ncbi:hypothetical protein CJ030_MR0G008015 [Morella rubra]|uniref:Uncharacterized protein n=1 Tax=Morella rubra TaxID=262757 RepID=A0A6A1UI73_9ROSI|nr:hypothetical protein CJ030_MR0G008015 [Morella rubra]
MVKSPPSMGKVAEEDGARTLETEEGSEKRNVIPEEIILQPVTEGVNSSISTVEVIDKSFEREHTGTNVEVATKGEKGKQNVKDEILALVQSNKSGHVEGKQDELTTVASKPLKEV